MKAGKEHRVPLSDATLAVLHQMHDIRHSDYVFPGGRDRRPLSEMSLLMLLRRMGHGDITAHGFRSTFRDWAAERTNFPREVAEMALAHAIPDAVEAAYRRGDLFDKRRKLMDAWAAYQGRDGRGQGGCARSCPNTAIASPKARGRVRGPPPDTTAVRLAPRHHITSGGGRRPRRFSQQSRPRR